MTVIVPIKEQHLLKLKSVLTDANFMIKNELRYINTGKHTGAPMRDCRGQWAALQRELVECLEGLK